MNCCRKVLSLDNPRAIKLLGIVLSKKPPKILRGFFKFLTEITRQDLAAAGVFQPAYGLFLDLAHALARQVEFLTNLFQRHWMAAVQPEV